MIKLLQLKSGKMPDADYILEKTDKFYDLVDVLTPKFNGTWTIILVDPTLKFVKELVDSNRIPEWLNVVICTSAKKIEELSIQMPQLSTKKETAKEVLDRCVANMKHMIDPRAKSYLFTALRSDLSKLQEVLEKLDKECEGTTVTVKQVQGEVANPKIIYGSNVIDAFLLKDKNRWNVYYTLVKDLGNDKAYYTMRKYALQLLVDKNKYLHNEDVKSFIVKRVEAPYICFLYLLFFTSTSPKQLAGIMYQLDNRKFV